MLNPWLILVGAGVAIASVGCKTTENEYYNKYWELSDKPTEQIKQIEESHNWYGDEQKVAMYVDQAMANIRLGSLKKAAENLRRADLIVDENFKAGFADQLGKFLYSEDSGAYIGDTYEQVQLPMLRSIVFAQQGNWETARAMARRTNDIIAELVRTLASAHGFSVAGAAEDSENIDKKDKKAELKWHYTADAFAYYVAGAAAYNDGDRENSLVSLRKAVQTYKSDVYVNNYLVKKIPSHVLSLYCHVARTIDNGKLRSADARLGAKECKSVGPRSADEGEVVVVNLHGRAATKQSLNVDIDIKQGLVRSLVAGAAVPIFTALIGMGDANNSEKASAEKDRSSGSTSVIYKILLGLVFSDPLILSQIAFQVNELERTGTKQLGSQVTSALGALSPDRMRLSVPVYLWYPGAPLPAGYAVGDTRADVELAHNLDGIRERELFDTMSMAMVRSVSRGLFRFAISEGAARAGGGLVGLAVGAATKSTESAEVRSLRSLPQAIYTSSHVLSPGEHELSGGNVWFSAPKVKVEKDKVHFVIGFSGTKLPVLVADNN